MRTLPDADGVDRRRSRRRSASQAFDPLRTEGVTRRRRLTVSRPQQDENKASKRRRCARTAIGHAHIDVCEPRLAEGKLHMSSAIDRARKFVRVGLLDISTKMDVAALLRQVVEVFPYAFHTVLTDNGMASADLPKYRDRPTARWMRHTLDRVCSENGIGHRPAKPYCP